MKRAAIITITDYLNYGNRLQNYAVQQLLKSHNLFVESIANYPVANRVNECKSSTTRARNAMKLPLLILLRKITEKISEQLNRRKFEQAKHRKQISFKEYGLKYMAETNFVVPSNQIPLTLADSYDYFVIGSDQIWNPHIRYVNSFDFATFAPSFKKIALSPSFGVSSINDDIKPLYSKWLSEIPSLSVREDSGARIVKDLIGIDIPVLIDPTLMLSKEEWFKVSEINRYKPSKPYLLTYFIGKLSSKRKNIIQHMASQNNLELVQLASIDDIKRFDVNPGEFVDYISSASLVCTDSFHATIFSMIMKSPFLVFEREGKSVTMSSRLDTLLFKFKMTHRKFEQFNDLKDLMNVDFSHIESILSIEQKRVQEFLKQAIN